MCVCVCMSVCVCVCVCVTSWGSCEGQRTIFESWFSDFVSYLSWCWDKILDKSNREYSIRSLTVWQQEQEETGPILSTVRNQSERSPCFSSFSYSNSVWDLVHGMVSATFRFFFFFTSINLISIIPHTQAQRLVSMVMLYSIHQIPQTRLTTISTITPLFIK